MHSQTDDVWNNLKAKLAIPFYRAKSQGLDSVDWEREIMSFRQLVMTGMAFNTPDPPGSYSVKYPPRLIMEQLLLWLNLINFVDPNLEKIRKESEGISFSMLAVQECELVKNMRFHNYFLCILNMMGFIWSSAKDLDAESGDDDSSSYNPFGSDSEEKISSDENIGPIAVETNQFEFHTAVSCFVNEHGEFVQQEESEEDKVAVIEEQTIFPCSRPLGPARISSRELLISDIASSFATNPIADLAVTVYLRLLEGAILIKESFRTSQIDLYQKYKSSMTLDLDNNSPGIKDEKDANEFVANVVSVFSEFFGKSKDARKKLSAHPSVGVTWKLWNDHNNSVKMAYMLANVIEEEIYVIHIGEQKGYKCLVSGCSDNKMLGIAIASTLIQSDKKEEHLLTGSRPNQTVQDIQKPTSEQFLLENDKWSHPFTFSNWTCIKKDGQLPFGMSGASHWLWPEGSPHQIQKWKNNRVVILGKSLIPRKFDPVRVFGPMEAKLSIIEPIANVNDLILEIARTEDSIREQAIENHKKWKS